MPVTAHYDMSVATAAADAITRKLAFLLFGQAAGTQVALPSGFTLNPAKGTLDTSSGNYIWRHSGSTSWNGVVATGHSIIDLPSGSPATPVSITAGSIWAGKPGFSIMVPAKEANWTARVKVEYSGASSGVLYDGAIGKNQGLGPWNAPAGTTRITATWTLTIVSMQELSDAMGLRIDSSLVAGTTGGSTDWVGTRPPHAFIALDPALGRWLSVRYADGFQSGNMGATICDLFSPFVMAAVVNAQPDAVFPAGKAVEVDFAWEGDFQIYGVPVGQKQTVVITPAVFAKSSARNVAPVILRKGTPVSHEFTGISGSLETFSHVFSELLTVDPLAADTHLQVGFLFEFPSGGSLPSHMTGVAGELHVREKVGTHPSVTARETVPLATGVVEGAPGHFTGPAGFRAPSNLTELQTITPTTGAWVRASYVVVGGTKYTWDGLGWAQWAPPPASTLFAVRSGAPVAATEVHVVRGGKLVKASEVHVVKGGQLRRVL